MKLALILLLSLCGSFAHAAEDALDVVNEMRVKRGMKPFIRDDGLTRAAAGCADFRAINRIHNHTANDFTALPKGTWADASGCAAVEDFWGFMSCCKFEKWTYAGAAWTRGADGLLYCHLFVRGREGPDPVQRRFGRR
jgi:hypothetical protein